MQAKRNKTKPSSSKISILVKNSSGDITEENYNDVEIIVYAETSVQEVTLTRSQKYVDIYLKPQNFERVKRGFFMYKLKTGNQSEVSRIVYIINLGNQIAMLAYLLLSIINLFLGNDLFIMTLTVDLALIFGAIYSLIAFPFVYIIEFKPKKTK